MFSLTDSDTFYLYPYPTDMRKSFYSLSGIVTNQMGMDIQDGLCFIFVNRSCTCMKILHMEGDGLVIYRMKLAQGQFAIQKIRENISARRQSGENLYSWYQVWRRQISSREKRWTSSGMKDSKKASKENENRP